MRFAVLLTLLAFVSGGCAANTHTVCPGGGCNYTSIQAAIDNATAGDTIEVHSGTYNENVNVNKQLILRGKDTGAGKPVVDTGGINNNAIVLSAGGIVLDGFTAINASNDNRAGIYVDLNNNIVINCTVSNNYFGILLHHSNNNTLTNNTALNNADGVRLYNSSNNTLTGNTASNNAYNGIILYSSSNNNNLTTNTANSNNYSGIYLFYFNSNNTLVGNIASNNDRGIYLDSTSNNNTLTDNVANSNNNSGIYLYSSSHNNTLMGNNASNNNYGIYLGSSSNNNTLTGNTASNNYDGIRLESSSNNTLTGNTALNNSHGIFLISLSTNNTLKGNTANSNYNDGIRLGSSSNNTLTGNTALNNNNGIYLRSSSTNNNLTGNTASNNGNVGIRLESSSNNHIYNNYFDNWFNAEDDGNNIWNITKTAGTNIIGGSWLGGNYWSDYTGEDTDGDGLGDTLRPYNSSGGIQNGGDWLPLVQAEPSIFDTGEGSYPSISGTFTGTITPSRNLTVSRLYTYPCAGTGGHTKSIELYDDTTPIASGVWSGYHGDWHNITFTEVTLLKDHEYRYVIVTGSYPQIIHAPSWNATGGRITCSEFVDINGKRHEGWIPAIKLS